MELGLLFLILLAKAQGTFGNLFSSSPAAPPAPPAPSPAPAPAALPSAPAPSSGPVRPHTIPWPQVLPPDLPPFPAGWMPANPVTGAMVSRAFALLSTLWANGEGTWVAEKTGDRWVVYQARMTKGPDGVTKTGVVAFTAPSQAPAASAFNTGPTVTPGPSLLPDAQPARITIHPSPPTPRQTEEHTAAEAAKATQPQALPTLRVGSKGPSVVWLQQRLGIGADGSFGPNTQHAVIAFQQAHGLAADGVVGPNTWRALGSTAQAA